MMTKQDLVNEKSSGMTNAKIFESDIRDDVAKL